jgi:hypothetical protein
VGAGAGWHGCRWVAYLFVCWLLRVEEWRRVGEMVGAGWAGHSLSLWPGDAICRPRIGHWP